MDQQLSNFSYRKAMRYVKPHYKDRVTDSLNNIRAQQQMIEGGIDTFETFRSFERKLKKIKEEG